MLLAQCDDMVTRKRSLCSVAAMLNNAKIIAFVATTDAAKSRAFYEEVLGLAPALEDEFAIVLDANGVELRIQKVQTSACLNDAGFSSCPTRAP